MKKINTLLSAATVIGLLHISDADWNSNSKSIQINNHIDLVKVATRQICDNENIPLLMTKSYFINWINTCDPFVSSLIVGSEAFQYELENFDDFDGKIWKENTLFAQQIQRILLDLDPKDQKVIQESQMWLFFKSSGAFWNLYLYVAKAKSFYVKFRKLPLYFQDGFTKQHPYLFQDGDYSVIMNDIDRFDQSFEKIKTLSIENQNIIINLMDLEGVYNAWFFHDWIVEAHDLFDFIDHLSIEEQKKIKESQLWKIKIWEGHFIWLLWLLKKWKKIMQIIDSDPEKAHKKLTWKSVKISKNRMIYYGISADFDNIISVDLQAPSLDEIKNLEGDFNLAFLLLNDDINH